MEHGRAAQIDSTLIRQRLPGLLVGGGLFTLHAGVYLLLVFSLFIWNLMESPADLSIPAPRLIIPWGVLVLLHAAVVAAYSVLHDTFAPEEAPPTTPPAPPRQPVTPPTTPPPAGGEGHPRRSVSRFRPTATTLADVQGDQHGGQHASWRNPVKGLRHAAATLRHDENGNDEWRPDSLTPVSEEEQRTVGNQQLARWRGGRSPVTNGQSERTETHPSPSLDGKSNVVRPLAANSAEFDETEWRWLEAAATSHLAQRGPDNGKDSQQEREAAPNGTAPEPRSATGEPSSS